jgi:predicted O-methyltransferase YrrM
MERLLAEHGPSFDFVFIDAGQALIRLAVPLAVSADVCALIR